MQTVGPSLSQLSQWAGMCRGWLCSGPRDCSRCTSHKASAKVPSLGSVSLGTSRRMCLPQLSCSSRKNHLGHAHSCQLLCDQDDLEEPSMKYFTVGNISVTSWQSGFRTRMRTDTKRLDFLLSSPFPSRLKLDYADGKFAPQLTLQGRECFCSVDTSE